MAHGADHDQWSTRAESAEHIVRVRAIVVTITVMVREELTDGRLASKFHTVEITTHDGGQVRAEVGVFGERAADGRFSRIEELSLLLEGGEADRGLASRR